MISEYFPACGRSLICITTCRKSQDLLRRHEPPSWIWMLKGPGNEFPTSHDAVLWEMRDFFQRSYNWVCYHSRWYFEIFYNEMLLEWCLKVIMFGSSSSSNNCKSKVLNFINDKIDLGWQIITSMMQRIFDLCLSFHLVHFRLYIICITNCLCTWQNETKQYFAKWYFVKWYFVKDRDDERQCGVETITSSHKKQTLHMASQYFHHSFPLLAIGF